MQTGKRNKNWVLRLVKSPELYLCIVLAIVVAVLSNNKIGAADVMLREGDAAAKSTSFPIVHKIKDTFTVSFKIVNPLENAYDLRLVPDDCAKSLKVDGKEVSLEDRRGLCDYGRGFVLRADELKELGVRNGSTFEVSLKNNGGDGGLNVLVENTSSLMMKSLGVAAFALLAVLVILAARRLKYGWLLAVLLALGFVLRFGFFMAMPNYDKFGHDVDGHVAYVHYIVENKSIPDADDCWTCYHPPVYYAVSAPVWAFAGAVDWQGTDGLQVESLLLSLMFMFVSAAFLRKFLSGAPLGIATSLVAFWPVLTLVAPRIGNDQLFYLLHAICLWGGVCYLKSGRGRFLMVAAVATALAYWTKTTGVVTVGCFALFAACGYVQNCRSLAPTKSEVVSWVIFALTLLGIVAAKLGGGSDLVGNAQALHSGLKVGNDAANFLYFDLKSFLTEPYTSPWHDGMGREYFLNYMFKTSLFGEFKLLDSGAGHWMALLVSGSFLGLLVYAVRGIWKSKLEPVHWILVIQGVVFVAALGFLRNKIPYSCSNDFRYIIPALLSFFPFVGMGIHCEGASCKWKVFGYTLLAVFVVASVDLMVNVALKM